MTRGKMENMTAEPKWGMGNIKRHKECPFRTKLGNCNPIGGFCTSVNETICEGLHKVSRPKGEWINDTRYSGWTCTHCNYHDGNKTDNFCPNCGADMRGEIEEGQKMNKKEAIKVLNTYDVNFDEYTAEEIADAIDMAMEALEQEPIIHCKNCKYWHEWENGTGDCHRSNSIWVGTDYDDYCSFAESKGSDNE